MAEGRSCALVVDLSRGARSGVKVMMRALLSYPALPIVCLTHRRWLDELLSVVTISPGLGSAALKRAVDEARERIGSTNPVRDLMLLLLLCGLEGGFQVDSPSEEVGTLYVAQGHLVCAKAGALSGYAALEAMLSWPDARLSALVVARPPAETLRVNIFDLASVAWRPSVLEGQVWGDEALEEAVLRRMMLKHQSPVSLPEEETQEFRGGALAHPTLQ